MAVKTYANRRGEIFGEISGGARKNYVRDALGCPSTSLKIFQQITYDPTAGKADATVSTGWLTTPDPIDDRQTAPINGPNQCQKPPA